MQKTKIDWADMTWNPVTGCLHKCPYCYAKKISDRFGNRRNVSNKCHEVTIAQKLNYFHVAYKDPYPFGFDPTFHHYRIGEPQRVKKPQNIFVCSMADLFGEWVPDEWIEAVFDACAKAQQHRYLFLTKNPIGYTQLYEKGQLPSEHWYGITLDHVPDDNNDETEWTIYPLIKKCFVSIEPLTGDVVNRHFPIADWYIIGAETGNRKGKIIPERKWIENIVTTCREQNIPVFLKSSLASIWGEPLIQEYPWGKP